MYLLEIVWTKLLLTKLFPLQILAYRQQNEQLRQQQMNSTEADNDVMPPLPPPPPELGGPPHDGQVIQFNWIYTCIPYKCR